MTLLLTLCRAATLGHEGRVSSHGDRGISNSAAAVTAETGRILQVVTTERERQLPAIGLVPARTRRLADTAALFLASGSVA
jgi:hypothetical protein